MPVDTRPHLVRVRGGFKAVCPCGWTSETKRSQSDVLDRLSAHQDGIRAKPGEARCPGAPEEYNVAGAITAKGFFPAPGTPPGWGTEWV